LYLSVDGIDTNMPQYRYKLARKTIKHLHDFKRRLVELHEEDDFISKELGLGKVLNRREECNERIEECLKRMYEVLNNPTRFKR
jgi:hypothetical protein